MLYGFKTYGDVHPSNYYIQTTPAGNDLKISVETRLKPNGWGERIFLCGSTSAHCGNSASKLIDVRDYMCNKNLDLLPTISFDAIYALDEIADAMKVRLPTSVSDESAYDFVTQYRQVILGKNENWRLIGVEIESDQVRFLFISKEEPHRFHTTYIEHYDDSFGVSIPTLDIGVEYIRFYRQRSNNYTSIAQLNEKIEVRENSIMHFERIPNCPETVKKYICSFFEQPSEIYNAWYYNFRKI